MPVIKVPLRPYTDFPALRKAKKTALLAQRVKLYAQKTLIEARLGELNSELFGELRSVLPADTKSVEFADACPICDADPERIDDCLYCDGAGTVRHQVTTLWNEPQRRFDRGAATTTEFTCPCSKCKGKSKEKITVPAKVVDKFYRVGKAPKPTVSVRRITDAVEDVVEDETT